VANGIGSWRFILTQPGILAVWVAVNVVGFVAHWDPYPFIFLNLVMSLQAAYAAPIIMMSQNRQGQKDRLAAEQNYQVNIRVETEITAILQHFEYQDDLILQILHRLDQHGESATSKDRREARAVAGDTGWRQRETRHATYRNGEVSRWTISSEAGASERAATTANACVARYCSTPLIANDPGSCAAAGLSASCHVSSRALITEHDARMLSSSHIWSE